MKSATLSYGIALILLGIAGYVLTGAASVTALIPAFFGLPLVLLALGVEAKPGLAIAALVLALLGLGGAGPGLAKLGTVFDGTAERAPAVISQSVMAVLTVVYVIAWFRLRRGGEPTAA